MKAKRMGALMLGFLAGLLNGLLGAGGGIVLVRGAERILPREYHDGRDIFANALAVMLPISAVSAIAYVLRGSVHGLEFSRFILPAVIGGAGGGNEFLRGARGLLAYFFMADRLDGGLPDHAGVVVLFGQQVVFTAHGIILLTLCGILVRGRCRNRSAG